MTKEILNKIAKSHKINLEHYDKVWAKVDEQFKWIIVTFYTVEVLGGQQKWCDSKNIKLSVSAALKRNEWPDDYATNGGEWLFNIR